MNNFNLFPYEVEKEASMSAPLDFNQRSALQPTDKVYKAEITSIIRLTELEKLFHVKILDDNDRMRFSFQPGQFVMLEVPGFGEIPLGISSSNTNKGYLELTIRKVGGVTTMLHRARPGAKIGIRGPFGTAFPMQRMHGHHVFLVAGGLGLSPLRAPIYYVTENRSLFRDVHILYGTKDRSQLLFDYQYEQWRRIDGVNLEIILEKGDPEWKGETGMVTKLLDRIPIEADKTYAIVCGPPVMFKFVCSLLSRKGVPMHRQFVSLERRMHCGMGKCYRCNIGHTSTCLDGPVFDYWSVMNLKEAI
jgi:sulfhydrogenase subunit gamma (sulfur reductase)